MVKRKDFDVLGVLLGIVIGVMIGYFISGRLELRNSEIVNKELNSHEEGYIYLLQIAKFDNPNGASNYNELLNNKNISNIVVYDKVYYYIYAGIATSIENLASKKQELEAKGYIPLVKKEYILDMANCVLDNDNEYNFWQEGINNLLNSMNNKEIVISEKYYLEPINLEFFSNLTILQSLQNEEIKNKVRLQSYRIVIEKLS